MQSILELTNDKTCFISLLYICHMSPLIQYLQIQFLLLSIIRMTSSSQHYGFGIEITIMFGSTVFIFSNGISYTQKTHA